MAVVGIDEEEMRVAKQGMLEHLQGMEDQIAAFDKMAPLYEQVMSTELGQKAIEASESLKKRLSSRKETFDSIIRYADGASNAYTSAKEKAIAELAKFSC
jgi:hypothetical protein